MAVCTYKSLLSVLKNKTTYSFILWTIATTDKRFEVAKYSFTPRLRKQVKKYVNFNKNLTTNKKKKRR